MARKHNELAAMSNDRVRITDVSWESKKKLSYDEWVRMGERLGMIGRNSYWWIGDWLSYGADTFRERADGGEWTESRQITEAMKITGYARQTLLNMASCARRIPPAERHPNLSFGHHLYVASHTPEERERWLTRCEEEGLVVDRLRVLVKESRGLRPDQDARTGGPNEIRAPKSPREADDAPPLKAKTYVETVEGAAHHRLGCPHCGHTIELEE